MGIIEGKILNFLQNKSTPAETEEVIQFFNWHPDRPRHAETGWVTERIPSRVGGGSPNPRLK